VLNCNIQCDVPEAKKFRFVAGNLSLNFTNTVGGKRGAIARENLHTYGVVVSWGLQAGLLDDALARTLVKEAEGRPTEAASVLNRAIELREAIYRIFFAFVENGSPSLEDIQVLNRELASGLSRLRVTTAKERGHFEWDWAKDEKSLDQVLGPIARSAAELLTSHHAAHQVRQCGGDNCGWLFLDASKNHSRHWCDMRDCGNRAKVRRHRLRQRREASG